MTPADGLTALRAGVPEVRRDLWSAWRRLPAWVQALAVFAASRLLVTFVVQRHARLAPRPDGRVFDYLDIAGAWDGTWYARIVVEGYPTVLPRLADGSVAPSTWAFYPLYPTVVRWVMAVTGAGWPLAATLVSLACSAGAVVLMRALVERVAGRSLALWTVVLFCFFPTSAVLQLPYAEGLAILLLVGVLACLQRHAYLAAVPLVLLVGLARPVAVPLAAVVGLHLLRRLARARGGREVVGRREVAGLSALCAAAAVAAVEWPLVAAVVTGEPAAYTETMAAWRTPQEVTPFLPWWNAAQHYLGTLVGVAALAVLVLGTAWWLTRPGAAVVAGDLRAWVVCYGVYLLAVLDSFTSLPRYLLPLFPLGTVLAAVSPARAYRVAVTVAFAVGGVLWLWVVWRSSTMAP